jgi:hypothetical protein
LARLGCLPEYFVDEPQLSTSDLIQSPPTRTGVPDEALPVPDNATDVEFIVEYAVASADMTADGGVSPSVAERPQLAFPVQVKGNLPW